MYAQEARAKSISLPAMRKPIIHYRGIVVSIFHLINIIISGRVERKSHHVITQNSRNLRKHEEIESEKLCKHSMKEKPVPILKAAKHGESESFKINRQKRVREERHRL